MVGSWRLIAFLTLLLIAPLAAAAQDLIQPSPALAPADVVEIQLGALQHNDEPGPDAGILQTWIFAHPNNKRATGPLERFRSLIRSPGYRLLLGHRAHEIEAYARTEDSALFTVTVVAGDGRVVAYRWELRKAEAGEHAGSWMTVSVSPPFAAGDSA